MTPDATPEHETAAQIAFAAYAEVLLPLAPWGTPGFAQLPAIYQHAWAAAAQAVLARRRNIHAKNNVREK